MDTAFNDGKKFDLSGPFLLVRRSDGVYVAGGDSLTRVDNELDGTALIRSLNELGRSHKQH